ncbi:hypothetical protein BV22DRAFT_1100827 [Leucogyrophana mollusca]|uniref:Uncharacterized protein n=1 Tax=Leucogyrophana mollusca TaxID=85980 RepID=A0ACB8AWC3_9AGAM|nr:hypothetical protein BV22DRAFT_1100827 [Leucogyrophana mollusca]
MDSTLTLVNPTSPTQYYFSASSLKNTSIFVKPSRPVYTVTTALKADKRTELKDARTGRTIAIWERREFLPDTIAFPDRDNGSTAHVNKWLDKTKLSDGYPVHVMQTAHGSLVWKSNAEYRLGLYPNDNLDQPLAYYQLNIPGENPALVIESAGEQIRDDIIASFLILEQRLRMLDKNINVGGGKLEQNRTVFGHYV